MRTVAAEDPAIVLSAGDNSYLASLPILLDRNIFRPLHDVLAEARLWATEGEHDVFFRNGAHTTRALHLPGTAGRYVTAYGPIQIVALGVEADGSAVSFARRALAQPGYQARFILVTEPIQPGNPILPVIRRAGVAAILQAPDISTATSGGSSAVSTSSPLEPAGKAPVAHSSPDPAPTQPSASRTTGCASCDDLRVRGGTSTSTRQATFSTDLRALGTPD